MSESEEEFASADEGENESATTQSVASKRGKKVAPSSVSQSGGASGGVDSETKQSAKQKSTAAAPVKMDMPQESKIGTAAGKDSTQRGKGKNSKQKKKPGKKETNVKDKSCNPNASKQPGTTTEETKETAVDTLISDEAKTSLSVTGEGNQIIKGEATVTAAEDVTAPETSPISSKSGGPSDLSTEHIEHAASDSPGETYSSTKTTDQGMTEQTSAVGEQHIERNGSSGPDQSTADETVRCETKAEEREQQSSGSGWGSWSTWGTSLVSAASASVTTFTNQVGEGFTTVLETVESTLGAPPPEELAKTVAERKENEQVDVDLEMDSMTISPEEKKVESAVDLIKTEGVTGQTRGDDQKDEPVSAEGGGSGGGWFSSWGVSNLTSMVSDTGKTLVTGSLDVLETLGKKTYDVLTEHDPGLRTALKGGKKPNLSSTLREAKEQAVARSHMEHEFEESRQANFSAMFDEYQGLAHLEALEMLSNQSEHRVQTLLSSGSADTMETVKARLIHIKQAFELEELDDDDEETEHDFSKLITEYLSEFHLGTSPSKLNAAQVKVRSLITDFYSKEDKEGGHDEQEAKDIHKVAIQSLAEMTSKSMEQFHKAGELLLLQKDRDRDIEERAKSLASLTRVLCTEVGILSVKFTKCLNKIAEDMDESQSINTYITNVYLEASNSSTYIQDAFQLLLPVLQQAAIQEVRGDDTS